MAGEDGDLIAWVVRGSLEAAAWSVEQLRDFFQRRSNGLTPAAAPVEVPSSMYEIPASGSIDPNWYIQLAARHQKHDAYMLTLTKTASTVAANVRITGNVRISEPLRFIGDTEWPGEFPTMEPKTFVVLSPGIFGEFTPKFTIGWDGFDGVRREAEFPLPGRFGMW